MKCYNVLWMLLLCLVISSSCSDCKKSSKSEYIVAQDGSGDFRTLREAFDALTDNATEWRTIYLKPGTYKEKLVLDYYKNKVRIVGENPENTVLAWDDHTGKVVNGDTLNTYSSYTLQIRANEVTLENITVANTAGQVGQAVALDTWGDQIKVVNCRLLGDQDTFYTKGPVSRVYVKSCYIEGTTDYIFGPAIVFLDNCTIHSKRDSYVTAASTTERNRYGYVFRDCKFTADSSVKKLYLGRPWRSYAKTVLINCELPKAIRPEGWHNWRSEEKEKTVFYAEYNSKGEGAAAEQRVAWSHQLTTEEAAEYTPNNVFRKGTVSEPFYQNWVVE